MIGIYIDCLRGMTEFCERRGFEHEDFPALAEIIDGFDVLHDPVITLTKIKKIVAHSSDLASHEIDKRSKKRQFVFPRQLAQYFSWLLTDESLEKIGRIVGKRDHATVINSRKRILHLRETKYPREDYVKLKELDTIFAPYVEKKREREKKS